MAHRVYFLASPLRRLMIDPRKLLAPYEPAGHVGAKEFEAELEAAAKAGFVLVDRPAVRRSYAALLILSAHNTP
jgi:hypothetical protein